MGDFPSLERQLELDRELFELDLDGDARMLLGPELGEEGRDPLPYRKEVMNLGMTRGTEDN